MRHRAPGTPFGLRRHNPVGHRRHGRIDPRVSGRALRNAGVIQGDHGVQARLVHVDQLCKNGPQGASWVRDAVILRQSGRESPYNVQIFISEGKPTARLAGPGGPVTGHGRKRAHPAGAGTGGPGPVRKFTKRYEGTVNSCQGRGEQVSIRLPGPPSRPAAELGTGLGQRSLGHIGSSGLSRTSALEFLNPSLEAEQHILWLFWTAHGVAR